MTGEAKLWRWFGLSRASWITVPRVLAHAMPDEWQGKMAELLEQYEREFPATDLASGVAGTRVQCTDERGKLTETPVDLISYRHPSGAFLDACRGRQRDEVEP